jgi:cathepsin D
MVSKCTLLTAITLVTFASAAPVEADTGVSIPLHKRSSLTRPDGVFDYSKAVIATVRAKNKYRQNLLNLLQNGGQLHGDAQILPVAEVPAEVLSKRQNEPLADEEDDILWAGTITMGSNDQQFFIDFDSKFGFIPSMVSPFMTLLPPPAGSSDLWVLSSSCTSSTCRSKKEYNASTSSTSSKQSGNFSIVYGDGSTVSGPIYTDSVTVAGISVSNQYFSPVTTLSSSFADYPIDGYAYSPLLLSFID